MEQNGSEEMEIDDHIVLGVSLYYYHCNIDCNVL